MLPSFQEYATKMPIMQSQIHSATPPRLMDADRAHSARDNRNMPSVQEKARPSFIRCAIYTEFLLRVHAGNEDAEGVRMGLA